MAGLAAQEARGCLDGGQRVCIGRQQLRGARCCRRHGRRARWLHVEHLSCSSGEGGHLLGAPAAAAGSAERQDGCPALAMMRAADAAIPQRPGAARHCACRQVVITAQLMLGCSGSSAVSTILLIAGSQPKASAEPHPGPHAAIEQGLRCMLALVTR
jgi:hypothetical protein